MAYKYMTIFVVASIKETGIDLAKKVLNWCAHVYDDLEF